jgi:ribosome-associated protein
MPSQKNHIMVKKLPIRLGQFLKLADQVQDGFEAKIRIQGGETLVNGEVETRRGRQLQQGDVVQLAGKKTIVVDQD